jgi:hypothetical protein
MRAEYPKLQENLISFYNLAALIKLRDRNIYKMG